MNTKVIDSEIYTATEDGSYLDSRGGEWVAFEKSDIISKIRWAEEELAKIAKRDLTQYDVAALYTETLEIRVGAEEDLRIVELLFG